MPTYEIYTDGACVGNPGGRGGWAFVILKHGKEILRCAGSEPRTTNNRMEIVAVLEGLAEVPYGSDVVVYSDSKYVVNGANSWSNRWKSNGWFLGKRSKRAPVKNRDLWEELVSLKSRRNCHFKWVRGHASSKWNKVCDELAQEQASNFIRPIQQWHREPEIEYVI